MFSIDKLVRENIRKMIPYSSARDEFKGSAAVFMDANENAHGSPLDKNYNRYPDTQQLKLKEKLGKLKNLPSQNIFLGNGSDEVIDLLFRAFCDPGKDNVIILPPTYGMYEVAANTNDVAVKKVNLTNDFQLNTEGILKECDNNTKLIFICSPNNPTGNVMNVSAMEKISKSFDGIIVIDEAYIDFSNQNSFVNRLSEFKNVVVLQTLSKAYGLAGLRLGMAFAGEEIIYILNKIKYPYNVNSVTQELALKALDNNERVKKWITEIITERDRIERELMKNSLVKKIYPSDANFLLVKIIGASKVYRQLVEEGIVVRDRSGVALCEDCLRITIGTKEENDKLINAWNNLVS